MDDIISVQERLKGIHEIVEKNIKNDLGYSLEDIKIILRQSFNEFYVNNDERNKTIIEPFMDSLYNIILKNITVVNILENNIIINKNDLNEIDKIAESSFITLEYIEPNIIVEEKNSEEIGKEEGKEK